MKQKFKTLIRNSTRSGDWKQMNTPTGTRCSECGFFHPPVAPGQCPVANGKKDQEAAKAAGREPQMKRITSIYTSLNQRLLETDPKKMDELLTLLERAIRVFK